VEPLSTLDAVLAEVAEELTRRLQAGEAVDLQAYEARYPAYAESIRRLLPALEGLANLGCSALGDLTGTAPPAGGGASLGLLGDYRLLRELGRGGMGVVYEAEQVSLGRRVALKVLPAHRVDADRIRRFEREARAAGRLHHTNIVPVFGVGQENGTYYYVMQFIPGQPLDAVFKELLRLRHGAPETPVTAGETPSAAEVAQSFLSASSAAPGPVAPAQPIAEAQAESTLKILSESVEGDRSHRAYARNVARIGAQVADALEYAAGQGVLHRDIKPSNLLLDLRGTVWITDFGLAKAAGLDELTETGDLIGTLRYMAPERFRGHSDVRSDVYSLGLTLYELLALRPAFGATDREAVVRQITQAQLPRLDQGERAIPRDLATVVHKAIAHDPADRYPTAAALAADLRRFLDDRPIAARRLGPVGIAWRWCWRNPAMAGLAALVIVLLVGGTVGSALAAYRYNRLARSERTARDAANQARAVADRRAAEAQAVVTFLINDLLDAATPHRKLGKALSVDEVLDRADAMIQGPFADQPLVEASIRQTLGTTYAKIAQREKAVRHLSRACALRTEHLGPEHADTLAATGALATALRDAGRWSEARTLFERVLEVRTRVLGREHPDTITAIDWLALLARDRGDFVQAQSLFERVLEARRRTVGPEDLQTLDTMNQLGMVLRQQANAVKARTLHEQVIEARRRILGPEHPHTLDAEENVAHCLALEHRLAEAQAVYERVYEARRRVLGPEHPDTIGSLHAAAGAVAGQAHWSEAAPLFERILSVRPDHFLARVDLAALRLYSGDRDGYQQHRAWLLENCSEAEPPSVVEQVAKICSLVDDKTGAASSRALALARSASMTNPANPFFKLSRGAAELRAGRLNEAAAELTPADLPFALHRAERCFFLALALERLGMHAGAWEAQSEARRLLAEFDDHLAGNQGRPGVGWREWLTCLCLLPEVEAVVSATP
jgi:serine/threonine protein kinase